MVTSAGTNYKEPYANINSWPSLLAAEIDIVTVGSVAAVRGDSQDGLYVQGLKQRTEVSLVSRGDLLTVNGPGNALCAGKQLEITVELAEGEHRLPRSAHWTGGIFSLPGRFG